MRYEYKMTQRPFGIGCQPKGWIDCINSNRGETGYHSIAVYDRELTGEEIRKFELTPVFKDKGKFSSLEEGDTVKIRSSVYDHFDKAIVLTILDNEYCVLDWNGTEVSRHKSDFNTEPLLFCA